jgi:LPS-assembly lipoprotein
LWFRSAYAAFGVILIALASCGFEPVYQAGSKATALNGNIVVQPHTNRDTFELREALLGKLGFAAPTAPYRLAYTLSIASTALSVTSTQAITRYSLTGTLKFSVIDQNTDEIIHSDSTQATGSYSATAETFPTAVAERDARIRVVRALADATVARLSITAKDWAQ